MKEEVAEFNEVADFEDASITVMEELQRQSTSEAESQSVASTDVN